jgi:alanine dehydrogenase
MKKIKVGVLHETKTPPDKRTAVTPNVATEILKKFPNVELFIQPSNLRAFKDDEYIAKGLTLKEDLSDCDILIGVKEVKIEALIPDKKYLFFAHIAKKQEHNKPLIKALMQKKITMVDYEYLTDKQNRRLVAFGYWAGVVGAYNGMRAWGLRTKEFEIKPANEYHDKKEMYETLANLQIKPLKIVITGGGRVATGAVETLKAFGIKEVIPEEFLTQNFNEPVFTKLDPCHYVRHKDGKEFDLWHFFKYPQEYFSTFKVYTQIADLYIAAHFWNPQSPRFFTADDTKNEKFNIKVVADISCDIDDGPIGSTLRASTIANPFYDFNPKTAKEEAPFSSEKNITVMAVDNLPGELPRDASEDFSNGLLNNVFPSLFGEDKDEIIKRATILDNGTLTEKYSYLKDWILE